MCQEIIASDGPEIQTVGELRRLWPELVADPCYPPGSLDDGEADRLCLCPVDIEASAAKNGAQVVRDAADPMVWWLMPADSMASGVGPEGE